MRAAAPQRAATAAAAQLVALLLCVACGCVLSAPAPTAAQNGGAGDGGWRLARGTYYGAPERIAKAYDPSR